MTMIAQLDLFSSPPALPAPDAARALARRTDPDTSREAAAQIAPQLGRLQSYALSCVAASPGLTASELEEVGGDRRSAIGRRLPELLAAGRVTRGAARRCAVTGRSAHTWHPAGD